MKKLPQLLLSSRPHRLCMVVFSIATTLAVVGCMPGASASPKEDPTMKRISEEILIKKVCLDGVNYYATRITDAVDSIAGLTYWVVGGAVFSKGNAIPDSCEK